MIGKPHLHFPYHKVQERKTLRETLQSMYQYSPSLIKLLMRMISLDYKNRPTFQEISGVEELKATPCPLKRKYSL